jgi:hypothetical protein
VTFGSTAASLFIVVTDNQIAAVVPTGPPFGGAVDIFVTGPGGTSAPGISYTFVTAPVVVSLNPTSGPVAGGNNSFISGSGFTSATAVTFGSTAATSYTVVSDTLISAVVPPGPSGGGSVSVSVTAPGSTSAPGVTYTYIPAPAPVVSLVGPTSGPVAGGNTVFIIGSHLTSATAVTFGSTAATSFTVVSDTLISAVVPPGPSGGGSVSVSVTAPGSTSAPGVTYTYIPAPAPVVSLVGPTSGPVAGGNTVFIIGSHLTSATSVTFGSTAATSFTVITDTLISAVVPPGPSGGGSVSVSVTGPGGTSAPGVNYTYIFAPAPPPVVTLVSPTSGPVAGGNTVSIIGSHLTSATAVTFGSTAATSFTVVSDTLISAVVPPGPSGGGSVSVSVTAPGSTSAPGVTYTYIPAPAPVVSLVGPTSGPVAGGNTVFIIGSHLTSATAVTFGSTAATSFTVITDTLISAVVPPGPSGGGSVSVRVTGPGGTSAPGINYTYV